MPIANGLNPSLDAKAPTTAVRLPNQQWTKGVYEDEGRGKVLTDDIAHPAQVADVAQAYSLQWLQVRRPLDTIALLDQYLEACNRLLCDGGKMECRAVTSAIKQQRLRKRLFWGISHIARAWHYLWHRVCSKIAATRWLYYLTTGGTHRAMCRVEILGRLYRAGFEVVQHHTGKDYMFLHAVRKSDPSTIQPSIGTIIKLRRIGKKGKTIDIYKFRTMHSYSEFLQESLYHSHQLARGGKIARDYRITTVGHWMRAHWVDEFPMLLNLVKGDIKLVGVRPLSPHYFSLYTTEMQQLRTICRPGLLPPFYAEGDLDTIEDIQANERRYLEAWRQHPWKTDWNYFWKIVANILFKRKRSH